MTGKKSLWMLFTILLVSFAFMVFIGGTEPQPTNPKLAGDGPGALETIEDPDLETVELRISVSLPATEFAALSDMNEQFLLEHPEINVQLQNHPQPVPYYTAKSVLMSGQADDVFMAKNEWIEEFAASGLLLPLDQVLKNNQQSRYFPQLTSQLRWNGYIWGLPKEVDAYIWVYDEAIIAEAGLEDAPIRLEELLQLQDTLLNRELEEGQEARDESQYMQTVYLEDANLAALASLLLTFQSDIAAMLEHPLLGEELKRTIKRSVEEMVSSEVDEIEIRSPDAWNLMRSGKIGLLATTVSEFLKQREANLAIAPMRWQGQGEGEMEEITGLMTGNSFVVPSHTTVRDEAIAWLQFMVLNMNMLNLEASQSLSARMDAYGIRSFLHIPFHDKILQAFEKGRIFNTSPYLRMRLQEFETRLADKIQSEPSDKSLLQVVDQLLQLVESEEAEIES